MAGIILAHRKAAQGAAGRWTTALTIAVLAALVERVGSDQHWTLTHVAADTLRNCVVAAAVVLLMEIVRRRYSSAHPTPHDLRIDVDFVCGPGYRGGSGGPVAPDELVGLVRGELNELTALADQLYGMANLTQHEPEVTEEAFARIDDLRWLLGSYVVNGGRVRRLAELPRLLRAIDALDRPDVKEPHRPIGVLRSTAAELLAHITDTNTRTVAWLLAHRVALP
ncbi:MAG: hypothetical protein ABWY93_16955, partial [Mycobacterium sp.]